MRRGAFVGLAWAGACAVILGLGGVSQAASVTGDPAADGWHFEGNSLEKGVYVRTSGSGENNYGYDIYTSAFRVTDSSVFDITGHDGSDYDQYYRDVPTSNHWDPSTARQWEVGDRVVGVAGEFNTITAEEAGWGAGSSFTGDPVNENIDDGGQQRYQAKFGTANASWTTSTEPPIDGDGSGSTGDGGGSGDGHMLVRTTGWLNLGDDSTLGARHSGEIMGLQQSNHLSAPEISVDPDVARVIWQWNTTDGDDTNGYAVSWQILINTSLIAEDAPGVGLLPGAGDPVITTVGPTWTDAMVTVVPLPAAAWGGLALLGAMGGVTGLRRKLAGRANDNV